MQAERETTDNEKNILNALAKKWLFKLFQRMWTPTQTYAKSTCTIFPRLQDWNCKKKSYIDRSIFSYIDHTYISYISLKTPFFEWTIFILLFINLVHLKKVVFFLNIYMKMNITRRDCSTIQEVSKYMSNIGFLYKIFKGNVLSPLNLD